MEIVNRVLGGMFNDMQTANAIVRDSGYYGASLAEVHARMRENGLTPEQVHIVLSTLVAQRVLEQHANVFVHRDYAVTAPLQ